MFDFESFCADDFAEEQPIHPGVWAGINWEADIPDDLRLLKLSEWDCVFGKENRESSNPPNKRCYIFLLRTYLGRLPKCAFENDKFYWQAKQTTPLDDGSPWFAASPCGRNNLGGMMKQICGDANISLKTNHTLRATGTTRMFAAHVPEKIIQQRTGHRSLDSLRKYERTSLEQQRAVSSVLASSDITSYTSELRKVETSCESETELSKVEKSCKSETELSQSKDHQLLEKLNLQHCDNCTINVIFLQ